jgi:hypothetical protein
MKKYFLSLALIGVLMIGLTGCLQVPEEEPVDTTPDEVVTDEEAPVDEPVVEEEKSEMAKMIEDFANYEVSDVDPLISCPPDSTEALAFIATAVEDGVKELKLMDTEHYKMTLYLTANAGEVDTEEFKKVINEGRCLEAGSNAPLKAYDEYLLWGRQMCSTGVALMPEQPGYFDFLKCLDVQDDLRVYLEGEAADVEDAVPAGFRCPEEGTEIDCEPSTDPADSVKAEYCEWVQENCEGVGIAL